MDGRIYTGVAALVAVFLSAGCASSTGTAGAPTTSTGQPSPPRTTSALPSSSVPSSAPPSSAPPSSAQPSSTPPSSTQPDSAPPPSTVVAHDTDGGRTVTLTPGEGLRVVLRSTYWQFDRLRDSTVLRADGAPQTRSQLSGCVPGGGCGTVTATYTAVAAGRVDVTAHRSICGEAMGCTAATGSFTLHVVVR